MRDALLQGGELIRIGGDVLRVERVRDTAAPVVSRARSFGKVVGASAAMRRLYPLCERVAASDVPVLIEGETGTGKEVLAEFIHEASPRAAGPFVVFDCTEVPPSLAESELFGHERGSFTGATALRKGVFEQAHGGTLFIDEIGELPPELQPKLLRAVERSEVRRVGGDRRIAVDVRLVAATRRDSTARYRRGASATTFSSGSPSLASSCRPAIARRRRRRARATFLVISRRGELPYDVLQHFESYAWPGNVRELRNAVARRLALGELALPSEESETADGGGSSPTGIDFIEQVLSLGLPLPRARARLVREFERRYVARVLAENEGNATRAAHASGIARRYFNILRSRRTSE